MKKQINILLIMLLLVSCLTMSKKRTKEIGLIQISHIGDEDKPIRDFFIHTEKYVMLKSNKSSNILEFMVSDSLFQTLEKYVIEKDTHKTIPSNYDWGTFKIIMNSKSDSLMYILDNRHQINSFFINFVGLLDKNTNLSEEIETEIINRFNVSDK